MLEIGAFNGVRRFSGDKALKIRWTTSPPTPVRLHFSLCWRAVAWAFATFLAQPFKQFYELRRRIVKALIEGGHAESPSNSPFSPEWLEGLKPARSLGSEMVAFAPTPAVPWRARNCAGSHRVGRYWYVAGRDRHRGSPAKPAQSCSVSAIRPR
jgi:hypothetical protein